MEIAKLFHKDKSSIVINGKTAIEEALRLLHSKVVAIPTYTCSRLYEASLNAKCKPLIVDCGLDLQIKLDEIPKEADTVIIPHMFGIQVDLKSIDGEFKIIEDCSQCMGLPELGKHSDIVIASLGPTKWLPVGSLKESGGGLIMYNYGKVEDDFPHVDEAINMFYEIEDRLENRKAKAKELQNAGVKFIGSERPNAWLRGMYFTENQTRVPYTPLHDLYEGFDCPVVDGYKNKLDWVSIFP
jgi:hypothetical protein